MEGQLEAICKNCEFWDERMVCPFKDLRELYKKKMNEGEMFEFPRGDGLKRLNKICSSCKVPLFIEEKKCPICGSKEIQTWIMNSSSEYIHTYNYNCIQCKRVLYSHIKIL